MKRIFGLFLLLYIVACDDRTQTTNAITDDTASSETDIIKYESSGNAVNPYGFDTAYEISKGHQPFMVTGLFNPDDILDTAILIRHKITGKDALFIKHGLTNNSILLKKGRDVQTEFDDFNWVGQFSVAKKGTKIWDNVIDGEIVGEDQVPDSRKFLLNNDGIFIHVDEASGGGIIYFKNGKYVWVQQE